MNAGGTLDPRDAALMTSCPALAVPRFSPLPPMDPGQRIVLAANGIFLHVKRDWLDCTHRVAAWPPGMPLPYGAVEERLTLAFGKIPLALLAEFIAQGRAALPHEIAGAIVFDGATGETRLVRLDAIDSGAGHIRYRMPALPSTEALAVDLHTHGRLPSFFSRQDDADDAGGVKIAGVFGNLGRERPSACFRLCLNGVFKALPVPEALADPPGTAGLDRAPACPTLAALGFFEEFGDALPPLPFA